MAFCKVLNSEYWFSDGDDNYGKCERDTKRLRERLKYIDVNKHAENGATLLMYANYAKEARILIAAGADINARDNRGMTVLAVIRERLNNGGETATPCDEEGVGSFNTRLGGTEDMIDELIAHGAREN